MADWEELLTEQRNPASAGIDEASTLEMLAVINREDARIAPAIRQVLPAIARAVDLAAGALARGGRLFYAGAGTSGRLGILDAAECPPTYSTDPETVQALIAGGPSAVFAAVEGIEDQPEAGVRDLRARDLGQDDLLVGIAASGVTPYVLGALDYARTLPCPTVLLSCSPSAAAAATADVKIVPEVGPEVITGSTRMKAGTATKMVLNMISTGAMVKRGKTYGNLMVDLQPKNAKLRDRAVRILAALAQISRLEAHERLGRADWDLKLALVMALCRDDRDAARELLRRNDGMVKRAVRAAQTAAP